MAQTLPLFPVALRSSYPPPAGFSADAALFGMGANGIEYVIKTVAKTPLAPGSEWFCHRLISACGIPTPQIDKIELHDGTLAFGSQWEGGKIKDGVVVDVLRGAVSGNLLSETFSKIYAFDLLVNNTDRHPGNYLFVQQNSGIGVRAFDFSRAWVASGWPLSSLPMPPCHTVNYYRDISKVHAFDLKCAEYILDVARKVSTGSIKTIIGEIPASWLSDGDKKKIVKWWSDGGMSSRVDAIKKGLKDGTYL